MIRRQDEVFPQWCTQTGSQPDQDRSLSVLLYICVLAQILPLKLSRLIAGIRIVQSLWSRKINICVSAEMSDYSLIVCYFVSGPLPQTGGTNFWMTFIFLSLNFLLSNFWVTFWTAIEETQRSQPLIERWQVRFSLCPPPNLLVPLGNTLNPTLVLYRL